ncbi:MAG: hypothetical protein BWK80_54775 [Desulfobacteraceae bacterium IS3]|nr:MAG: hypothetical protein BWK80_54775 [Desulfobacteraceae bacterium IS3]
MILTSLQGGFHPPCRIHLPDSINSATAGMKSADNLAASPISDTAGFTGPAYRMLHNVKYFANIFVTF